MRRVLIAGCGYVGRALGIQLAAEAEVWGLRRSAGTTGQETGIRPIAADLTDPATLRDLPIDLDGVVYAASAGGSTPEAYEAAYVRGLENLLAVVAPRRLIFVSSTAVYGDRRGAWTDEDSPTEPDHFSGRLLLEAEKIALGGPSPAVVLRLGGIYGPGRERLIREVAEGRATRPAEPLFTNRIHREDAAGAIAHLLALERPEAVYLGVDSKPADLGAIYSWIAARLGRPEPATALATGEGRLARGSKRCSNARLVASGYRFAYPTFREGYGEMVDRFAAGG
ncbi:MAG TPA: SDR family oxidoreductase [Thermoanaerobaculia bacterium]|jgi:nucleoside-diphosphate-sugar epimerase|nr:SDR family oxidoreductase [Thermoanaerobaculia bacterium]